MKRSFSSRVLSVLLAAVLLVGMMPAIGGLISLPAGAVNIVKPLEENMLLQGNFEGIDLRDWSSNVSGKSVLDQLAAEAEHSNGTRGLKLVSGVNENGIRATVYGMAPGATYRLSFWAKAGAATDAGFKVNLYQWTDAWGSDVKGSYDILKTAVNGSWAQYSCEFTMQVNRVNLQFDVINTAGTVLVDDVTLCRIAEAPSAYLAPNAADSYVAGTNPAAPPQTFEGWVEVDDTQSGLLMGADAAAVVFENGKLALAWNGGKASFDQLTLPPNEKFHFAVVADVANDTATAVINGEHKQTVALALDSLGAQPLYVADTTGVKLFSLAAFASPRSEKDIRLDMTRVPYEDSDLVAAYDFTAYGNERLEDHSLGNNHLIYTNGSTTETYDVGGMSFDANVTWTTTETLSAVPTAYTASVNLPADLNDYIPGGILIGNVGNRAASNNSVFSFEVAAMGQPRLYWNSKLNGKTNLIFDQLDLRTGKWETVTATIDTAAKTATVTVGETSQTLSYTKDLPPFDPYTTSDSKGSFVQETGWMPLTVGGDTIDGNSKYFRGKIASVTAAYADGTEALSYTLTDTDADGLVPNQLWIREVEEPTDYDYSMVTVGDTQIINWYYPDAFGPIYDYIAAQATAADGKMAMVMGLGDITEMGTAEEEMIRANEHVSKLDGLVEYSMIRGNHDSPAYLEKYFGYARYKDKLGGSYDGTTLNTWRTFVAGGVDYLLLTLEYFPKDVTLEWAADIVESHPNHTVIVTTHAFLDYKGDLLTNRSINSFTTGPAGDPDTSMWDILISKYDNIQLVLCGHISNQGVTQTVFPRDGLSDVTAMLIDPQGMDASIGATGIINTFYFGEEQADGTVDIDVVTYSTARGEYYGTDSQFTTSIKLAPKATATNSGSLTLAGDFTVNTANNVTSVTVPYTGTTTAPAGTRFAGQVTDQSDNSVLNAELVVNGDNTVTLKMPVTVAPEKLLVMANTVFTSFDNTLSLTIAADYNAILRRWVELTPENFHIWGNNYADQDNRCCIYFYSEALTYDPTGGTGSWENFSPQNQPILIDGTQHNALVIGETPHKNGSNEVAIIYLYESTVGIDGILANSDTLVIPQGTEVLSPDAKVGIRFAADVGMKKTGTTWSVYDPNEPAAPSDHSGIGPNLPDGKTNLVSFGSFDAQSGFTITGNGAVENGLLRMDITSSDDHANFQVAVEAGKTYRLSAYMWITDSYNIRIDGEASGVKDAYQNYIYSNANEITGQSLKAPTDGWVEMVYEFTATKTGTASIYFVRNYWGGDATVYVDDLCFYDVNEQTITYVDIDFDVDSDIIQTVGYNPDHTRTYLVIQTAKTLPIANWSAYTGSTVVSFDGKSTTGYAAGLNRADQFQIYIANDTTDYSGSTTITIPAGTEFTYGKGIVRFPKEFTIVNKNGAWVKYVPTPVPTDHGGDTEIPGNAAFVNMQNMNFDQQTGHSKVGDTSIADGMAKVLVSGSNDYLQLNTVSVTAGVEYTLAFYIWVTEASSDFSFNLYMATSAATPSGGWCDNVLNRNDVVTNTPGGIKTTTGGWQRVTVTWTPAADGDIAVGLKNYSGTATGIFYIDDVSLTYKSEAPKQTISIKKFSWAHSGIIGVNMGNYAELSATDWWGNYNSSSTYFYANGNVYLNGSETPTTVRIALPTSTNDNIFFYGMPADDEAVTLLIKEGEQFVSEKDDVVLVFDKEYVITKTAKNAATVQENSTKFAEYNVTLSSDMKVGVRIEPAAGVSLSDLTLTYTVAGGAAQTAQLVDGVFYCNVPAKDMTSVLTLALTNADAQVACGATATTTLRAYAEKLLNGSFDDKTKAAAKAMLNYGAMAQQYFDYSTGSLANTDYAYTQDELDAADAGENKGVHVDSDTRPTAYAGASLLLKSKIGIRLYFTENVGGNLAYNASRELYYYEIAEIGSSQLATVQTVTLDGVTYSVSVLSLARQVIDDSTSSVEFKNLMKAIALYYATAKVL